MNGYMSQLKGPFIANEELFEQIKAKSSPLIKSVKHLGIQISNLQDDIAYVDINDENIAIGKTGIYEVRNTEITSIKFNQDMDENTLLDFVIELKEEDN